VETSAVVDVEARPAEGDTPSGPEHATTAATMATVTARHGRRRVVIGAMGCLSDMGFLPADGDAVYRN